MHRDQGSPDVSPPDLAPPLPSRSCPPPAAVRHTKRESRIARCHLLHVRVEAAEACAVATLECHQPHRRPGGAEEREGREERRNQAKAANAPKYRPALKESIIFRQPRPCGCEHAPLQAHVLALAPAIIRTLTCRPEGIRARGSTAAESTPESAPHTVQHAPLLLSLTHARSPARGQQGQGQHCGCTPECGHSVHQPSHTHEGHSATHQPACEGSQGEGAAPVPQTTQMRI